MLNLSNYKEHFCEYILFRYAWENEFAEEAFPENLYEYYDSFAKAYRYSHCYDSHMEVEQQILEKNTGVLLIHELPDTVKKKETEAQAYAAVWDLMAKLEKNLPMAFVFYGQDTLLENNKTYDEIGIFLPNSHFLKNLERHVAKAEAILYG